MYKQRMYHLNLGQREAGMPTKVEFKRKILAFAVMWMDLESVLLSEVSPKEKIKHHILTHVWGI